MKIKRKIIIILVSVILLFSAGIVYLNNVILPTKIKSLIVKGLKDATNKEVSLRSLKFSIFKGLVLRNLVIYDKEKIILSLKEGSCSFLIMPFFRKTIAIPSLRLLGPELLLERGKDNTFNLADFFKNPSLPNASKFSVFIYKISVREGKIHFKDDTFAKPFTKDLEHLNLSLNLSLPAKVKFNIKSQINANPVIKIIAAGEYLIPEQELSGKISMQDISPAEFLPYYENSGINITKGLIDAAADLKLKSDILYVNLWVTSKDMEFSRNKNTLGMNSGIHSDIEYSLKEKQLNLLKGDIKIIGGKLQLSNTSIENINGGGEFNKDGLKWSDLNFQYLGLPYRTEGELANFQSPQIRLRISSKDLTLDSVLSINKELIKLSNLSGKYLNSKFVFQGKLNTANALDLEAEINGEAALDLEDAEKLFVKAKNQLEQIKPEGIINTQFSLKGNIGNLKSCDIQVRLSSDNISLYGLKAKDFALNYNQSDGSADIPAIHLSSYDGTLDGKGNINLNSASLAYWISADIRGINLEKLKLDTPVKNKDIAGMLEAQVKLNGYYNDISKLSGTGNILIKDGKLWQLNLFQGLGSLLFAKGDFANIVFSEGSCDFIVRDKYIFSDNLFFKSNITNLSGQFKIGFDSSLDASVNVDIIDEMVPLSGTLKDITTAIIGQGGKFGTIKISGTLQKPQYKFKTAVVDIIKGLKDTFFGR